ncbi:hypothetical protein G7Y79_00002g005380 [Physcia stellaris]|nr:hypothetical protein G7Y79_00002g005380 [Physcia stellaris]
MFANDPKLFTFPSKVQERADRATTALSLCTQPSRPTLTLKIPSISLCLLSFNMRFDLPSQLLLLSSLPFLTMSLPFQPRKASLQPRASYSVVNIDGSSGSAPSSSGALQAAETTIVQSVDFTKTITAPAQTLPPTTKTLLSTVTVEETQPAATILKTITDESTIVSTVSISIVDAAGPSTTTCTTLYETSVSTIPLPTTISPFNSTSPPLHSLPLQYPLRHQYRSSIRRRWCPFQSHPLPASQPRPLFLSSQAPYNGIQHTRSGMLRRQRCHTRPRLLRVQEACGRTLQEPGRGDSAREKDVGMRWATKGRDEWIYGN